MSATLDELVATVAGQLMAVDSTTVAAEAGTVLRQLVGYFGMDLSFLRFHDQDRRATILVAEWPPRPDVPDPDPLGCIFFDGADPTFAASEHLADVMVIRPGADTAEYQERVLKGSGIAHTSTAIVPLRSGELTTGVLGFVKFGDRGWEPAELRALRTIAALLAQLQARLTAEDQLRYLAHHDELTGLPNRRALLAHLEHSLAPGWPGPRAVLFVDVDRLKAMNDFLGHQAGDQFIQAVAARLQANVRPQDFVARLGGDEFVVVIDGPSSPGHAESVALRIQAAVAEPIELGGQALSRTVSVGLALARPGRDFVSEWLHDADHAVLAAKARGGNAVVSFTEEMRTRTDAHNLVEMHLQAAIRDGSLTLDYQPVVELTSRRVVAVEALARWIHPVLGPLQPDVFVGVAEATNLAGELGRWVLDEACRQLAQWDATNPGLDVRVHVNVSPAQLIAIDFVDGVAATLAAHGVAARRLVLEMTEQAVVRDHDAALATLCGLRKLGVGVAIDDFGTGYSSMEQLKGLPVSILKIDRAFVRDLATNPQDLAIVQAVTALAAAFGLELIAEGVEDDGAAEILADLGCTQAQGFLFSPPVPAAAMRELLEAGDIQRRCLPTPAK